ALVAAWVALAVAAFMHGYWLHIAVPIAAVIPPALFYVAGRLWLDHRIERQLEATQQAFRRFHAPALADYLAAHPDYLA
ncbi:hypothetical protein OFM36_38815, partial [Escherichia coli]|nr:hypothetical protein [Escherichia coli]